MMFCSQVIKCDEQFKWSLISVIIEHSDLTFAKHKSLSIVSLE